MAARVCPVVIFAEFGKTIPVEVRCFCNQPLEKIIVRHRLRIWTRVFTSSKPCVLPFGRGAAVCTISHHNIDADLVRLVTSWYSHFADLAKRGITFFYPLYYCSLTP